MNVILDPKRKQVLDDTFDSFVMLAGGSIVTLYDVEAQVARCSPSAADLLGLPGDYISWGANDWENFIHPEDRKRCADVMEKLILCQTLTYDLSCRVRTREGAYSMFRAVGAVLRNGEGKSSMIGGVLVNEGLMESTDPVTILRNQYGFFNDLSDLLREDKKVVVLLTGVNRLSYINEVHGYSYGNRVLQQVGWLIQESAGQRGRVYRMDGATFAFVTDRMEQRETSALYDSIRRKLQSGIRVNAARHSLSSNGALIALRGTRMDARAVYACLRFAYQESRVRRHGELVDFNGRSDSQAREALEMINEMRGCASIDFLKELSPDVVKFDFTLVKEIEKNEADRLALGYLSEMAALYSNVCVKGVETEGMRDILKQYPVRSMQGYLYSRPLSFQQLIQRYFSK